MNKLKVGFIYNIKPDDIESFRKRYFINTKITKDTFAEWDSQKTINRIKQAIEKYFHLIDIEADIYIYQKLLEQRPDIVFNFSEGFNYVSREAQVPAILDFLNIPYTGSDPETLINCLNKVRTKEILLYNNIPTPAFCYYNPNENLNLSNFNLNFPVIVKPAFEGSSKGIFQNSICNNIEELENQIKFIFNEYNEIAIVEELLLGREFTVGIIGNDDDLIILPIVEIKYPENIPFKIYSFELKWELDQPENPLNIFECPASISNDLFNSITAIIKKSIKVMRIKDWARFDIRLDNNGIPNIIEINPIPGILPNPEDNSCFTKAAFTMGYSYDEIIFKVIQTALKRWNIT